MSLLRIIPVLVAVVCSTRANAQTCASSELDLWVKGGAFPESRESVLPDWDPETNPCVWQGVTCEDGCYAGGSVDVTDAGLNLFEDPGCDAFSLGCSLFIDPSDPSDTDCYRQGSQDCYDAATGDYVNGFAMKSAGFTKILLGGNTLIGTWPDVTDFDSLEELDLSNHIVENDWHLLSAFPDFDGEEVDTTPYDSLKSYKCSGCNLVGTIPDDVRFTLEDVWAPRFPNLEELSLAGSKMIGSLPEGWGDWSSLQRLDLSNNDLTGSIPASWGNLKNLEKVDLSGNSKLSPELPESWETFMDCDSLTCERNDA